MAANLLWMRRHAFLLALLAIGIITSAAPTTDFNTAVDSILQIVKMPGYVEPSLQRDITEWLAIGDSFSAGISADKPSDRTNYYCSRFKRSYPNQMNENPRFPGHSTSRTFTFGSCTGAKMDDVTSYQIKLGEPHAADDYPKIGKPQIGTVSLSGNDLKFGDFGEIVNACLYHWVNYGDCGQLLKDAHTALDDPARVFELRVVEALVKILVKARTANPNFQLYVTGYIRFWNEDNTQCDKVNWAPWHAKEAWLTTTLRKDMNSLVLKLNTLLKSAVETLAQKEGGVYFIDEFDQKFDGHRFCEEEGDESYHQKPISDHTWFIHYESPYENSDSATGLGSGSFFDQVDGILIPPKDGKSTTDQIKEANGDLSKLNPAYESVDAMTKALVKLGNENNAMSILPVTWIRIMHPKGFGYTAMSDAVIDKVLQYGAAGVNGNATESDKPAPGLFCAGTDTKAFMGRDDLDDKIRKFCADAAKQKVQDKNSGSVWRKYNEKTRYEVDMMMTWPQGMDISDNCDMNNAQNPRNWKHGGTLGDGYVSYSIAPQKDQGYRPGSCSFHLRQNERWHGVDGPGTKRTWYFSVEQLRMVDNYKNEIGRAGFKDNNNDGAAIDAGDSKPYVWDTKLPDSLRVTPEANDDYIQFNIGDRSWKSSDKEGNKECTVGGWSSNYSPAHRDMDCSFPC